MWSTSSWKRRVVLAPEAKYAGKKLAAGLLAVSGVSAGAGRGRRGDGGGVCYQ